MLRLKNCISQYNTDIHMPIKVFSPIFFRHYTNSQP